GDRARSGCSFESPSLCAFQKLRNLFAVAQPDEGLLPVRSLPDEASLALELAVHRRGAHFGHLRPEQLFDRALDVDFRRVARHLEDQRLRALTHDGRLLGNQRPSNHVCQLHDVFPEPGASRPEPYPSTSCSRSTAAFVATMCAVSMT